MLQSRNSYLDVVKYTTIFLVLWGHVIQQSFTYGIPDANPYRDGIFRLIYTVHMPLFMGICGYFFSISLKKHPNYLYTKLVSRLKGIFIPMLSFGFIKLLIAMPVEKVDIYAYFLQVHGIWFLGNLMENTILIVLIYRFLNGKIGHDWKYFLLVMPLSFIPTPDRGGFAYGGMGFFMYIYFVIDKYIPKEKYIKAAKYIKLVIISYVILCVIYCFSSVADIGFTLNYHKYTISEILFADICKISLGFLGSYALLGIIWYFYRSVKNGWLYTRSVQMGRYTLDIYLLNIIILEMIGGGHVYPWLLQNVFHENILMQNGFFVELFSTFIVACLVMEIIVIARKILNEWKVTSKIFFYR